MLSMTLVFQTTSVKLKSVQIRSFFWSVFSCIRTKNNSVFGHFSRSSRAIHATLEILANLEPTDDSPIISDSDAIYPAKSCH